jgi:hypothetical protein
MIAMTRSHFSKTTLLSFTTIALVLTAAVAHAQPEGDLPPLGQAPSPAQPSPAPAAQPSPAGSWVEPAAAPAAEKPRPLMQPPPTRRATPPESPPVDLARKPWRAPEPAAEPELPPVPTPQSFLQVQGSMRASFMTDRTFGIFADDKLLPLVGAAISYTVLSGSKFSFAPGISFELGGVQSTFRGDATKLDTQRVSLRLDGRYHFVPWAYGFVRVAPGLLRQAYEVNDPLASAPLRQSHLGPSVDASAGAAFLIVPQSATSVHHVRFWLEVDGGYGWAGRKQLKLTPDLDSGDATRVGALQLGDLALRGGFVRFAGSLTF